MLSILNTLHGCTDCENYKELMVFPRDLFTLEYWRSDYATKTCGIWHEKVELIKSLDPQPCDKACHSLVRAANWPLDTEEDQQKGTMFCQHTSGRIQFIRGRLQPLTGFDLL